MFVHLQGDLSLSCVCTKGTIGRLEVISCHLSWHIPLSPTLNLQALTTGYV